MRTNVPEARTDFMGRYRSNTLWRSVSVLLISLLAGCQLTDDAWNRGGRDEMQCRPGLDDALATTQAIMGRDASVALAVRVIWNPAVAPTREYQRYYVFSADEIRLMAPKLSSEARPGVAIWLAADPMKLKDPGRPGYGRFISVGTGVRTCSRADLPAELRDGRELVVGEERGPGNYRLRYRDDGSPATVNVGGYEFVLEAVAQPPTRFQTPAGKCWQVMLVPIAVVGDILYTPIYVLYFVSYGGLTQW